MSAGRPLELGAAVRRRLRRLLSPGLASFAPRDSTGEAMLELARSGPAALAAPRSYSRSRLRVAAVIPSFRRGSGGHRTIVRLLLGLAHNGHEVSAWLEDNEGIHVREPLAVTRRNFTAFFDAQGLPLHRDLGDWRGADVVLATGWQTVPRALMLPEAGARAYLVQDHEPDFYPASAEALWAAQTYRMGLHCVAASAWLAQLLKDRYGVPATYFDLGVDDAVYRPQRVDRQGDLVIFYARATTPRRAVPLGLSALSELVLRRPSVEVELFGEHVSYAGGSFSEQAPMRQLGVLGEAELAQLYSRATVGLVFSLTNPSLIDLEMMACGLPCIDLASAAMISSFGSEGPLQLAEPDPLQLCAMVEGLLDDPGRRERLSRDGLELTATRTWQRAAEQVEAALWQALAGGSAG